MSPVVLDDDSLDDELARAERASFRLLDDMLRSTVTVDPPRQFTANVMLRIARQKRRQQVTRWARIGASAVLVAAALVVGLLYLGSAARQSDPLLVQGLVGAFTRTTAVLRTLVLAVEVVVGAFFRNANLLIVIWIALAALVTLMWLKVVALSGQRQMRA